MEPSTPISLAVGAYASPRLAQRDFTAVVESMRSSRQPYGVAELGPNMAGILRVVRHDSGPMNPAWGSTLLAASLVVFVAPVGAGFVAAVPAVGGAGAVTSHLERTIPRRARDLAARLLEGRQGVVVVAADRSPGDVEALLGRADGSLAMATTWNGLDRAIEQEIAYAQVNPSGT